jgi:hypothetical protein
MKMRLFSALVSLLAPVSALPTVMARLRAVLFVGLLVLAGRSALAVDKVLILESTVYNGINSVEAQAALALGFQVDIVNGTTWATMTASAFSNHRAIILGDPACGRVSAVNAAENNASTRGPLINGNVIIIVLGHPTLAGLNDVVLSHWGCSSHEVFDSWPSTYLVLAIEEDVPGGTYTAADGSVGGPYILARGDGLVQLTDRLSLKPWTASNPTNCTHMVCALENGGTNCANWHVSGCWFGVDPTKKLVAYMLDGVTIATPGICIAAYRTWDTDGADSMFLPEQRRSGAMDSTN